MIDQTKTREENLATATTAAERARELLDQYTAWQKEAYAFAPPSLPYGATKARREKEQGAEAIRTRLREVVYGPKRVEDHYRRLEEEKVRKEAARQQADDKARQEREEHVLQGEAVAWLLERGKKINVDFQVNKAVAVANELAFSEECERRSAALNGEHVDFDGSDYCENCSGWDGESHRCDCGNRRVSWTADWYHSFKSPSVRAEAN